MTHTTETSYLKGWYIPSITSQHIVVGDLQQSDITPFPRVSSTKCCNIYHRVCLSVSFVTLWFNFNTIRLTIIQFSPKGSPNALIFSYLNILRKLLDNFLQLPSLCHSRKPYFAAVVADTVISICGSLYTIAWLPTRFRGFRPNAA